MTQCLPSLQWSARCYGSQNVRFVVCALEPWQEETLALLGLDTVQRLVTEAGTQYRLPAPSIPNSSTVLGRLRIRVKSGHKAISNGSGWGLRGTGRTSMSRTY